MSQKIIDNLKTLGFTENEAEIYLALMKLSPCFVAPIIQETRKHRQMVYNALETLLKRNLITRSMKEGKQLYELANPERLMAMVEEQELIARETIEQVKDQVRSSEEQAEALRGLNGYKAAILELADSAIKTGEYLVINSIPSEYKAMTEAAQVPFLKKLQKVQVNGGRLQVLIFPSNREDALSNNQFSGHPFVTRVVINHPEPPQTIWISGDNVYLRNRLVDPLIVHITSPDLAKRYRAYFQELWSEAEQLRN